MTLPDDELQRWYASYPYNLTPVTDDSPFFWHFVGFRDALFERPDKADMILDPEDAKGERVLVVLLAFAVVFSALMLLAPFWFVREEWKQIPFKPRAAIYFAALGLGFMFYEIALIQKLTLFLGYPTYSLTVTLFAMLVFSGLGSLLSERYENRNRAFVVLFAVMALLTLLYQEALPLLVERTIALPLIARAGIASVCLAPLGLALGAFMPLGLRTVAGLTSLADEYIAWCWAVNGFFSVVSSVLATMLSMTFGFSTVMLLALGVYAVGVLSISPVGKGGQYALN